MAPRRKWTAADTATLRRLAGKGMPSAAIAKRMGRHVTVIRERAGREGITLRQTRTHTPWTTERDRLLAELYPTHRTADVAAALGASERAVYARANQLGIAKCPELVAAQARALAQRNGTAGRFAPGHEPWNKGIPGSTGFHPNCVRTQFKPGQLSGAARANALPLGHERINKDGLLERKVCNDNPVMRRRWVPAHRLVWEAEHGPPPRGHIVVFKPGRHSTNADQITPDALECISRVEHMRRNSVHRYPPEIVEIIQLRGALNRKINNRSKA